MKTIHSDKKGKRFFNNERTGKHRTEKQKPQKQYYCNHSFGNTGDNGCFIFYATQGTWFDGQ